MKAYLTIMLLIGALACGSDEDRDRLPGDVDTTRAKASSQSMLRGVRRATSGDETGGLAEILAGSIIAQSVVRWGTAPRPAARTLDDGIGVRGTCVCTETSCTYVDCEPVGTVGIKLDGTYAWDGGSLRCDRLRYEVVVDAAPTVVTLDCDVRVTDATVTGVIKATGSTSLGRLMQSATIQIGDVAWTSETKFAHVSLGEGGPTAGTARVEATSTIGEQTYVGTAELTFP